MNESMNACTHPKITELDGHVFCAACEPVERLDIVKTAGVIRLELKKAFPGTKFSVTTSRYSMGSSCSVSYTDGPPLQAVEDCIGWIAGKSFDGMDDSTHYHRTIYNGRPVQFSGMGPQVSRGYSDKSITDRIEALLKARISYQAWEHQDKAREDSWFVSRHWDARNETIERAVERFLIEGRSRTPLASVTA